MTTTNTVILSQITVSQTDPTKTSWGANLSAQYFFAYANGTGADESFDAADLSDATKALMLSYKRGVGIKMGAGNDTVIGSAYGDTITGGAGINKIDGGANEGNDPGGAAARDVLNIFVANATAANAVAVTEITSDGADAALYAEGYRVKVTNGTGETNYLKGVEQINIFQASSNAFLKAIDLTVRVTEVAAAQNTATMFHLAWVQGTAFADTFNATTDISTVTRGKMDDVDRGIWVDMGAGNDTVLGSAYGDNINGGAGTNYIDGGANDGAQPNGNKAFDVLHLHVASTSAADAVVVTQLTGATGLAGNDLAAQTAGYTHKVVNGSDINYIKNIERINIQQSVNNTLTFVKDIPLVVTVHEASTSDANIAQFYHLAWVNGTEGVDTIDASTGSSLLSTTIKTALSTYGRGVWINGGAGNDVITGTGYGDNFVDGAGNSKIDGGANAGLNGAKAQDVFEITVATIDEMAGVVVQVSDDLNYDWKVTHGGQTDYLKGIEAITVNVKGSNTGKWIPLVMNIGEIASNGPLTTSMHFAWANGTDRNDNFVASSAVSADTLALMNTHKRGVWVDLGLGDDSVTGSGYGDDITVGTGTNYVDGGLNEGANPHGGNATDVLHVRVANQAAADAVTVAALTGTLTGTDQTAAGLGYTHKVVNGTEVDYIKGIERVSIELQSNNTFTFVRDVPLTVVVYEANMSDANSANFYHLAFVNGTADADTIDLSGDSALLSTAAEAAMATNKRGAWVKGGSGNDTMVGTGFGDNFVNGSGNSKIDGGANAGPSGNSQDVFEITVADAAAMSLVAIVNSDDANYTHMITYGPNSTQKDYLKNIEAVIVNVNGTTTGKWIPLVNNVREIAADGPLTTSMHYAWVDGTSGNDTFNAGTDISQATRDRMVTNGRGVFVNLGEGNDVVVGSNFGDNITVGAGTNFVDGGTHLGAPPGGGSAQDVLHVNVADAAAAAAVGVLSLTTGMTGADATAFTDGYTHKITSGTETTYVKNIERVTVSIVSANNYTFARDIPLTVVVNEVNLQDANLANMYHHAFVTGTGSADVIDLSGNSALLSANVRAAMDTNKRGVWVNGGNGNDTITGTAYGDNFVNGDGNSRIDGGANTGPGTSRPNDVFQVTVANATEQAAVSVLPSDDPNYTHMVTYGANSTQKDYLKNIEGVTVSITGVNGAKYIPIAINVFEVPSSSNFAQVAHVASINGTAMDESYAAPQGLSSTAQSLMSTHGRGIYVDMGAGNDSVTGSGFGDHIVAGAGVNRVDGGANAGTTPSGDSARDVLEMFVASQAAADAVAIVTLTSSMTGDDLAAFNAGYLYKISNGTAEVNYVRNVEQLNISVWQDKDGDGQRDYAAPTNTANEVTLAKSLGLVPNSAPTFGAPAGMVYHDSANGIGPTAGMVLGNGKLLTISFQTVGEGEGNLYMVATRANADGTLDSTFGANGIVSIPTSFGVVPGFVVQPDGKILIGMSTTLANGDFRVMRLNANGSVDTTFGTNGATVVAYNSGHDEPRKILLQDDGKIVLAGFSDIEGNRDFAAVRLTASGVLDTTFNGTGHLVVPVGTAQDQVNTAALADGKILLVGRSVIAQGNRDVSLVRVNSDGSVDTSFGTEGKVVIPDSTKDDIALTVTVQPDGKILVGGLTSGVVNNVFNQDSVVYRLNTDGSLDSTWGTGGKLANLSGPATENATAIAVQSDGKVVVLSSVSPGGMVLQRYNADGTPDGLFGTNGKTSLPTRGGYENGASLSLVDGKIVVFGTSNPGQFSPIASQVIARLNSDGTPDLSFNPAGGSSIGGTKLTNGLGSIVIDANATVYDAQLAANGNYGGATLTLAREGGANPEDGFGFYLESLEEGVQGVQVVNGNLQVGNTADGFVQVGTVHNANGQLTITFNNAATQARVNEVLERITYNNKNLVNPPETVNLTWTFSDGNIGGQGFGGARSVTATTTMQIGIEVEEMVRQFVAPTKDLFNNVLADRFEMAYVAGTARGESFNSATAFSQAVKDLMAEFKRGASIDMGAGNDTIVGTGYNDFIIPGTGINRVDGGANDGKVGFDYATDHVRVYVPTLEAAKAATIVSLSSTSTGEDLSAFQAGYEAKIVHGADTTYIKNVETVSVSIWNDANANGIRDSGELNVFKNMRVAVLRTEYPASQTGSWQAAANSGFKDDSYNVATDVSSATQADMATTKRGAWIDLGAGNDTAVGSNHPDNFIMGSGTNYVDGGAHIAPATVFFRDALELFVPDQAAANAVSVIVLSSGMSGTDATAFSAGYTHKVVSANATDYLKNIETVNIQIWNDKDGDNQRDFNSNTTLNEVTFARSINLALQITENLGANANASAHGSLSNESFNAATDLSSAIQTDLAALHRGLFIDMRGGNDTVVASPYTDTIVGGTGTNMIDGGANAAPAGQIGVDTVEVFVADQTAANAVAMTRLDGNSTGADAAAFTAGYTHKIVSGAETDYLKNVESARISIWNDKDGDGNRDYNSDATLNEVTTFKNVNLMMTVFETEVSSTNPILDKVGNVLVELTHFGSIGGSIFDDIFTPSTGFSLQARNLMTQYGKGYYIDSGAGNDRLTGSNYGDSFTPGSGINYIDGAGDTVVTGFRSSDNVDVYVTSQAAADAFTIVELAQGATGADGEAYSAGYRFKLVAGDETDYLKNVESVNLSIWNDKNGDGHRRHDSNATLNEVTHVKRINLGFNISEVTQHTTDPTKDYFDTALNTYGHFAWANGGPYADNFALTDVSQVTRDLMAQYKIGVYIEAGAGNDTAVGSDFGDDFLMGAGTNYVDGGGHQSLQGRSDVLEIFVPDQAAADGVTATELSGSMTGADLAAFNGGYTFKVVSPNSVNYVKGIESVRIQNWVDKDNDGQRDYTNNTTTNEVTFARQIDLAITTSHIQVSSTDPTKDTNGNLLSNLSNFAWINGTAYNDIIVPANLLSQELRDLMATHRKGAYFDTRAGNDRITGTDFGDTFIPGSGINYVDGMAELAADASRRSDVLEMYLANQAAADALTVVELAQGASGEDGTAFAAGYRFRIDGGNETHYVKNVEQLSVSIWNDKNGDGQRHFDSNQTLNEVTFVKGVNLGFNVNEVQVSSTDPTKDIAGNVIANMGFLAWANGGPYADTFSITNVSPATLNLMQQHQRGVQVTGGAGNDTAQGSDFSDQFIMGAGVNKVDGGANNGQHFNGHAGEDHLTVRVADVAAANAVTVTKLTGSSTGADLAAFNEGYTHRVSAGAETDYIKGIEAVQVQTWTDSNNNGLLDNNEIATHQRSIPMGVSVGTVSVSSTNPNLDPQGHPLVEYATLASVSGTAEDDNVSSSNFTTAMTTLMGKFVRGVHIDTRGGNDTIVGSDFGDNIEAGTGINKIDGGANKGGRANDDGEARDEVRMYVANQAAADAVTVVELSPSSTDADLAAFNEGYKFKVADGTTQVNYLKNVEQLHIQIWNDKDGDGFRDYNSDANINEVTYARGVNLAANTAPNFRPSPGVATYGSGKDYYSIGGIITDDGKWITLSGINDQPGTSNYRLVLTKANADMTLDTGFGTSGMANFPYAYRSVANPALTADGKILVAFTSPSGEFQVVRLNANGSVDSSFGSAGTTAVAMNSGFDGASALLVQADGKVVIAGNAGTTSTDFGVVRLNADGSLDTGFNGTGKLLLDVNGDKDIVRSIVQQADGKLVLAGRALNGAANSDVAVVRLNADGTLDTSFGGSGKVMVPVGPGNDGALDVKVMPDGSLLVAGWALSAASETSDQEPMMVRLNADGTLASTFAVGGKMLFDADPTEDWFRDIAIQPDGKILVLAESSGQPNGMGQRVVIARFNNDGTMDYTFGLNGTRELALQGIADQANTIIVQNGKIKVFASTANDANFNMSNVFAQLNMDGTMDAGFPATPPFTTGGGTFANGIDPFVLDINAAIYDAELAESGNYGGSRLTLQRQGGPNADDVFSAVGEVQFNNGQLIVGGIPIGAVTNSGGQLIFNFHTSADQGLVNRAMHGIAYTNSNPNQPASVPLLWLFNDQNGGGQGTGGPLTHAALETINFSWVKTETVRSYMDPAKSSNNEILANKLFFGRVDGSERADSFAYSTGGGGIGFFNQATRDLMAEFQRGAHYNMRGGDDTVTGTPYCDEFITGSGINRVDGGTNLGASWMNGQPSRDILRVLVDDTAQGNAVQFVVLNDSATGDDLTAFQAGYELKVVNGATVDYVKNVEEVTVELKTGGWVKNYTMDVDVYERKVNPNDATKDTDNNVLATVGHMAYANGWNRDDQIDANNLSAAVKQLMLTHNKGVYLYGAGGADGLFGSDYEDVLIGGHGGGSFNRLDGRGGFDHAEIYVADQAGANAVTATLLAGSSDQTDIAAAGLGFVYKLVSPTTGEVSYTRDVESVRIMQGGDANGDGRIDPNATFLREIHLALKADGIKADPNDATRASDGRLLSTIGHFGWAEGGLLADNFNAATHIPAHTQTLMNAASRGVFVFLGGGNDTAVGTGFGDIFNMGGGTNYVNGGANTGTDPQGNPGTDTLEIFIANAGDASQVVRSALTGTGSAEDIAAHGLGYTNKVVYGSQVHYLQNVENVMLQVWNDADGDGMRDYGNNEVTFVSFIGINDPA
jgi:uncharacterized delta-60 repeat protein